MASKFALISLLFASTAALPIKDQDGNYKGDGEVVRAGQVPTWPYKNGSEQGIVRDNWAGDIELKELLTPGCIIINGHVFCPTMAHSDARRDIGEVLKVGRECPAECYPVKNWCNCPIPGFRDIEERVAQQQLVPEVPEHVGCPHDCHIEQHLQGHVGECMCP